MEPLCLFSLDLIISFYQPHWERSSRVRPDHGYFFDFQFPVMEQ